MCDNVMNCVCIVLMSSWNTKYYKIFCENKYCCLCYFCLKLCKINMYIMQNRKQTIQNQSTDVSQTNQSNI